MRMDRKQMPGLVAFVVLAAAAALAYALDSTGRARNHYGSSVMGVVFGVAAALLMFAAAALRLRRAVPHRRLGRAQTWLRLHIWGGLLAAWLTALHAGFVVGGTLTAILWILVALVTISGLVGVAIQHWIPPLLMADVPRESVAQQTRRELAQLPQRLAEIVKACTEEAVLAPAQRAGRTVLVSRNGHRERVEPDEAQLAQDVAAIERFAQHTAAPFLRGEPSPLDAVADFRATFARMCEDLEPHTHAAMEAIESLCRQRRGLLRQRWWMRIMLGWLVVHVPVSYALLVLVLYHIVVAMRFIGS